MEQVWNAPEETKKGKKDDKIKWYTAFGQYLQGVVIRNLPPGEKRTRANAIRYLSKVLALDPSMINSWMNGGLVRGPGSKPLTVANCKRLLLHYLQRDAAYRRGLNSRAHVEWFLSLGLPEYRVLLEDPEVKHWLMKLPPGAFSPKGREGIKRGRYEREIWETWEQRQVRCVILHGVPGVGKTHLLREVHRQAVVDLERGVDVTVFVAAPRGEVPLADFLQQMAQELNPPADWAQERSAEWILRDLTGQYRVLFLVDDLRDGRYLQALLEMTHPQTRVLVSTRHTGVLLDADCRTIEVAPYTWEEVQAYARHAVPEVDLPPAALRDLAEQAQYNPPGIADCAGAGPTGGD